MEDAGLQQILGDAWKLSVELPSEGKFVDAIFGQRGLSMLRLS
jgi:hypothetical protein